MIAGAVLVINIVIILVVALLLDTSENVDPEISLKVSRTWIEEGTYDNTTPVDGKRWQIVEVEMKNLNEEEDVGISVTHFYSYSKSGDRHWIFNAEDYSYDPIPPGGSTTVFLAFMIECDQVLNELEYGRRVSSPASCSIPDPF